MKKSLVGAIWDSLICENGFPFANEALVHAELANVQIGLCVYSNEKILLFELSKSRYEFYDELSLVVGESLFPLNKGGEVRLWDK